MSFHGRVSGTKVKRALGVQAALEFFRSGKKPSGFTDTGVALVAGEKVAGVESLSAADGAARCWGTQ